MLGNYNKMLGNYNYLHCGERKFGFKEETRDGESNKGDNETHMWSVGVAEKLTILICRPHIF